MVDNLAHLAEFGHQYLNNKRNRTYSQQIADNYYHKIKVEDNMKNGKEYVFKVIVDPTMKEASIIFLPSENEISKTKETAIHVNTSLAIYLSPSVIDLHQ